MATAVLERQNDYSITVSVHEPEVEASNSLSSELRSTMLVWRLRASYLGELSEKGQRLFQFVQEDRPEAKPLALQELNLLLNLSSSPCRELNRLHEASDGDQKPRLVQRILRDPCSPIQEVRKTLRSR